MKDPAKLGFFQSFQDGKIVTQRAESVWVLAVHYDFKFNEEKHPASSKKFFDEHFRNGDDVDVGNLRKTFEERRNCNFYDLLSPTKEKLLELLADKDQLLQLFECKDLPDVFVFFFLSHGNENGVIYSDHCDKDGLIVSFTTDEIFQSLKTLTGLEKCLKLVNFGPCRGLLDDAKYDSEHEYENYDNRNSCRITFEPAMHNLVVFYSTVETTEAVRAKTGSWFVWNICSYFNLMREDEPLITVLTSIQWRIHHESQSCRMGNKLFLGQTPEVKILSQDSLFFFYKNEKPVVCQPSPKDALRRLPVKKARRDELYSWQSDKSQNLRGRRAFILSTPTADDITNRLVETLRQNLQFETSARKLSMSAIKLYFHDVLKLEPDVGCVLTCVFSQVSVNEENEVCMHVNSRKLPVSDILRGFIGPKIDKWIGKPKIFFLVDVEQQAFQSENISLNRCEYEIAATNHSGWLVVVLRDKKQFESLLKILDGDELKRGKSLQELLTPLLLISSTKKTNILLNSTLQYLLDFPVWPRIFVKPDFKFKLDKDSSEQNFSFDQLLQEAKITLKESRVWILSSVAGAGKTTILKEIAFELKQADFHVLNVMLQKHRLYFETCFKVNAVEFLSQSTNYSSDEINGWIESKRVVVSLDGFDEVCPDYRKKVLELIEQLHEKGISLWIGTRPHEMEGIMRVAENAASVKIEPFNEEKQREFLRVVCKKSEEECAHFLRNFKGGNILENPLHLSLLAECEGEDNLYRIYEKVVKKKTKQFLEMQNEGNAVAEWRIEKTLKLHRLIASRFISGGCLIGQGVNKEDLERLNGFGIATYINGELAFLHQTFAEFLTAQKFLQDLQEFGSSNLILFDCNFEKNSSYDRSDVDKFLECRKFIDLCFSTTEDRVGAHKELLLKMTSVLPPDTLLTRVCRDGLINIFTLLKPQISFKESEENFISVDGPRLFLNAIEREQIAIELLEMGAVENLNKMLPEVLSTIAELDAVDVLKRLKEKFASEMSRLILRSGQEVNRALLEAAKFGQEKLLAVLLEIGVDPKGTYQAMNALYRACEFGQINCVEILLTKRARTAVDGTQRYDPLVVAVLHGKLDLVKFLLEEKVSGIERDPETFEMKDLKVKWNALHYAIVKGQKEIVEYLLSQSSALQNIKTMDGIAPLQLAALRNEIEMCQWLVQKGVEPKTLLTFPDGDLEDWRRRILICKDYFVMVQGDINFKDDRGKTALHCAAEYGHLELVRELIELGADVEATDANGWNATHFALEEFQTRKRNNSNTVFDILKLLHLKNNRLASQKTKDGRTNLHIIYEKEGKCSEEVLRFLVEEAGVEVNAVDSRGSFVLNKNINCWNKEFLYTYAKSGKLHSAVETGNLKLVQQLCESGVDLNATGRHGMTALMIAGKLNQVQIIEFLLAKNANIKKKDGTGKNALHHSLHNFEITQLLHKKEKSLVKKLTIDGCTSLHLATNDQNGSMDVIRWLVDKIKINVNTCNERGETALMLASMHGSSDTLEFLLDKGADVNKEDNNRRTALMYTVVHENLNLFHILLERGAHLNYSLQALQYAFLDLNLLKVMYSRNKSLLKEVDEQGNTILHKAIKNEPKECSLVVVWWLIEELKIDLEGRNKKGETTLLVACKEERWEVVDLLLSKNVDATAKDNEGKSAVDYAPFLNI